MKPVFKCDYCNFMDTEENVKEHELKCLDNYNRKSCSTCQHRIIKSYIQYECACGKEIPKNNMFVNCEKYERREKQDYDLSNIFGDLFGGR